MLQTWEKDITSTDLFVWLRNKQGDRDNSLPPSLSPRISVFFPLVFPPMTSGVWAHS